MKWKERQGWDSGKISGIFSTKCVDAKGSGERRLFVLGFFSFSLVQGQTIYSERWNSDFVIRGQNF